MKTWAWKLIMPEHTALRAYLHRDIRPSDATVIYRDAIELFRTQMRTERAWPMCKTHWNRPLGKWLAFKSFSGLAYCECRLMCDECPVQITAGHLNTEFYSLDEIEAFSKGKI